MHRKMLNKCNQTPSWGEQYLPYRFFFGKGWTIATINHGPIGREIHVQSEVPLRNISTEIMSYFECDFFTTILPDNQKAINLALKTGFKFIKQSEIKCFSTGEMITVNIYKRGKTCQ